MLSEKRARWILHLVLPLFIALFSIFICADKVPETKFYQESIESLEDSQSMVTKLTAGTMGLSLVINFLPEDYGNSLADALADFEKYFVLLLVAIFLEKLIAVEGTAMSFTFLIPAACIAYAAAFLTRWEGLKVVARKMSVLALTIVLVIPCGTHLANALGQKYLQYVDETIETTDQYSVNTSDALTNGDSEQSQTLIEKFSSAISSAIKSIQDIADNIKGLVSKLMNSIAILIITTCIVPAAMFFFLIWILQQLFSIDFSKAARIPESWRNFHNSDDKMRLENRR